MIVLLGARAFLPDVFTLSVHTSVKDYLWVTMFIERYGSGNKIYVGLHGWSGDHRTFLPLVEHLPESATLYSVDLPGYGQSPAPREWTVRAVAQDVADAIRQINAEEITIVGSCSGAITALLAAPLVGDKIKRFILIDPFAYVPWYFRVFLTPGMGRYLYFATFANPAGRWITNLSLKGRRTADSNLTESFSEVNHDTAYRHLVMLAGIDSTEYFREIKTPIDICYGAKSFKAIKESATIWKSILPQARLLKIEGAGHLPIEEATEELSQIIF
jgi:pimeloyl-ACP methyl ester carboxylesterase